jgi:hypothetical protein
MRNRSAFVLHTTRVLFSRLIELLAPNRDARRPPGSSCFVFIEVCHVIREEISWYHVIPFFGGGSKKVSQIGIMIPI